jgi:REP element-mobilizing transposase RayT
MENHSGFDSYDHNIYPLAYLLTFRTFGTWLHGDPRGSHGRFRDPITNSKYIEPHHRLHNSMREELKQQPFKLNNDLCIAVGEAIQEVMNFRNYGLLAENVRSNHAHVVVRADVDPNKILIDLKAYATRRLRKKGLVEREVKVWSRGGSTRYLWKPYHVDAAIDYVLYCQEDIPFEFRP